MPKKLLGFGTFSGEVLVSVVTASAKLSNLAENLISSSRRANKRLCYV